MYSISNFLPVLFHKYFYLKIFEKSIVSFFLFQNSILYVKKISYNLWGLFTRKHDLTNYELFVCASLIFLPAICNLWRMSHWYIHMGYNFYALFLKNMNTWCMFLIQVLVSSQIMQCMPWLFHTVIYDQSKCNLPIIFSLSVNVVQHVETIKSTVHDNAIFVFIVGEHDQWM